MQSSPAEAGFVSDSIARGLERLAEQAGAVLRSQGADRVHDLRVAVRRFTQALAAFRDGLPRAAAKEIRRELKDLMNAAGEVRDYDIALKILAKCRLDGVAPLRAKLSAERNKAARALAGELRRWKSGGAASHWAEQLVPAAPQPDIFGDLEENMRKFLAHGKAAAAAKASSRQLHRLRIEGKKLRYTIELLEPAMPAAAGEWLEKLKAIQTSLGDVHDARMARDQAKRFGAAPGIAGWLKKRQRKRAREFRDSWAEAFPAAQRRRLLAASHPIRPKPMARSAAGPVPVPQTA
jgi:CHAD domain-containing protein